MSFQGSLLDARIRCQLLTHTPHVNTSSRCRCVSRSCSSSSSSNWSPIAAAAAAAPISSLTSNSTSKNFVSSSSSRSRSRRRARVAAAAASGQQPPPAAAPDLSSIRKAGDIERLLFAQMAQGQQAAGMPPGLNKPNAPVTAADFVEALEMIVRSKSQQINPEQLDEILEEILKASPSPPSSQTDSSGAAASSSSSSNSSSLLDSFTPAQLSTTVKNLAVICEDVHVDFVEALVRQLQRRLGGFSAQQLAAIGWGLMRLMPVAHEEVRLALGMDKQWLESYTAAAEQQLQLVLQQQQGVPLQQQQQQQQGVPLPVSRLPSAQQVANVLLLPAAALLPLQPSLLGVLEDVLLLRQASLCGYAVAQLLTCYVRLNMRPGDALLAALIQHMQEELPLYDYDELTQVAFNACVLQLDLPDRLLADITHRAALLEGAGLAGEDDRAVLTEALQRLAAQNAAATAAAGR